ncbi:tripartite motif-containing protein 2-like [Watersipora subatra]|uniref:tripartite motif-containing protein 2-like n=1 Tax=Watersipora subatra TaxID=2589382 RepID=UPI00355BACCC
MAEALADVECEFCCRKSDTIINPKVLPCSHIHCMTCLTTYYESKHLLLCGNSGCGQVFEMPPGSLPSYDLGTDKTLCDVCLKKSSPRQKAISYCTFCSKKFCPAHLESHDDALDEHHKITILEYLSQQQKVKVSSCPKHKDQQYVLGCGVCYVLSCLKCVPNLPTCDSGSTHSLLPLEDLASALLTGTISAESSAKDDQFERLFKRISKMVSEYDSQTDDMLNMIHKKRDEQINSLNEKYDEIEKKVLENRQKSKVQITDFLEDVVLDKWRSLRNHREMLETKIKHSPPDDIVRGFKELKNQMDKFIVEVLPKLEVRKQLQVQPTGEKREIELKIVSADDIVVNNNQHTVVSQQPQLPLSPPPKSLTLLKCIELPSQPVSVCQHEGVTYVGLRNGTVSRIDSNYKLHNSLISTSDIVESISLYELRLYILSYSNPRTVSVYDLSGQVITTWQHPYRGSCCSMLTVAAGNVVVADPPNKRLTIYSLTGKTLRNVSCPLLSNSQVSICAGHGDDVIIADYKTKKVFRFNITTRNVMWTFTHPDHPQGLLCYEDFILVAAYNSSIIYTLRYATGEKVSEMRGDGIGSLLSPIYSLSVTGYTLVVPQWRTRKLLFYKLSGK